jgi:hypothetical protein
MTTTKPYTYEVGQPVYVIDQSTKMVLRLEVTEITPGNNIRVFRPEYNPRGYTFANDDVGANGKVRATSLSFLDGTMFPRDHPETHRRWLAQELHRLVRATQTAVIGVEQHPSDETLKDLENIIRDLDETVASYRGAHNKAKGHR